MRAGGAEGVVSIVVPCLDEEEAIGGVVSALLEAGLDEVVVVDGDSRDRTEARAEAAGLASVDGGDSDRVEFAGAVVGPVLVESVDLVVGSRPRGPREPGSLGAPQIAAGRIAGLMFCARSTASTRPTWARSAPSAGRPSTPSACARRPSAGTSTCRCAPRRRACGS